MALSEKIEFEDLNALLKASSKQQVIEICKEAFDHGEKEAFPNHIVKNVAEMLSTENSEAAKLLSTLSSLIRCVLFQGYSTHEAVVALFPGNFHKNLRELLSKIIVENYSQWKTHAVSNSVSLPKLVEFDWRVDLKMASSKVARMSSPTCILHLKIQDPSLAVSDKGSMSTVNVELSKETLDTMLHGLGRIRDQLSAVAKK